MGSRYLLLIRRLQVSGLPWVSAPGDEEISQLAHKDRIF